MANRIEPIRYSARSLFLFMYFFAHPMYYLRIFYLSFSLPRRNSDPGSLSKHFSPLPTMVHTFVFIAIKIPALSSLVDSRRNARSMLQVIYFLLSRPMKSPCRRSGRGAVDSHNHLCRSSPITDRSWTIVTHRFRLHVHLNGPGGPLADAASPLSDVELERHPVYIAAYRAP